MAHDIIIGMAITKAAYYTTISRNTRIYREMTSILRSFNKEGIKAIPLKGIFLAEKVYNSIGLRPMGDVDLMIKKEELPRADRLLGNLGYKKRIRNKLLAHAIEKAYINSVDFFKSGKNLTALHVHWHIVNVTLPTYMYTKNIKMERFWECARPTRLAEAETLELAPHHLIMHLAEHALKHSFDKPKLLTDIDASIKKYEGAIDWQKLLAETKEFGMERQLYYGLYFTKYFLNTGLPDYVLPVLRPKKMGFLERRFFNSVANNKRDTKLCYFVYLGMIKGVMNKARFILRTLFPPPSVLALTFNLNKAKITIKDYFSFLIKQFIHFKNLFSFAQRQ